MVGHDRAMNRHVLIPPDLWVRQIFSAQVARDGGIVRRKISDVDRIVGRDLFEAEFRRRGFRAVENAVTCH